MWKKVVKYTKKNGIVQIGQTVSARVGRNDVSGNAAQLAYYMLFSIFPMLLIAATLLAYLHIDKDSVFNMIKEFAPDQIMDFLEENLNNLLTQKNGGLLSIGIIATLWSASNGMNAVMKSLNKAYGVTNKRKLRRATIIIDVFHTRNACDSGNLAITCIWTTNRDVFN